MLRAFTFENLQSFARYLKCNRCLKINRSTGVSESFLSDSIHKYTTLTNGGLYFVPHFKAMRILHLDWAPI